MVNFRDLNDPRCWSTGNEVEDYSQCKLENQHDEPHEDEEGNRWVS